MRLFHILLLPLCLLFAQVGPGAGLLASLFRKETKCDLLGGNCYLHYCPADAREKGTCYGPREVCCI